MGRAAGASLAGGRAGGHYLATTRARKARHQCCMSHHQGLRIAKSEVGARRPGPGRGPPVAWFVELAVVEQQAKNIMQAEVVSILLADTATRGTTTKMVKTRPTRQATLSLGWATRLTPARYSVLSFY